MLYNKTTEKPYEVGFLVPPKGGFPLLRKCFVRTGVNLTGFTYLNKIRDDVRAAYVNQLFTFT